MLFFIHGYEYAFPFFYVLNLLIFDVIERVEYECKSENAMVHRLAPRTERSSLCVNPFHSSFR